MLTRTQDRKAQSEPIPEGTFTFQISRFIDADVETRQQVNDVGVLLEGSEGKDDVLRAA